MICSDCTMLNGDISSHRSKHYCTNCTRFRSAFRRPSWFSFLDAHPNFSSRDRGRSIQKELSDSGSSWSWSLMSSAYGLTQQRAPQKVHLSSWISSEWHPFRPNFIYCHSTSLSSSSKWYSRRLPTKRRLQRQHQRQTLRILLCIYLRPPTHNHHPPRPKPKMLQHHMCPMFLTFNLELLSNDLGHQHHCCPDPLGAKNYFHSQTPCLQN